MNDHCTDKALVRLRGVVKTYHSGEVPFTALKGIDLDVHTGEFIGLIGKSGSGKTTLINMITGIDHPTSGEVVVAVSGISALFFGVFLAFFLEFIKNNKSRHKAMYDDKKAGK